MNDRPKSLHEIATRAEDLTHYGWEFADWLHTLRTLRTRAALVQTIAAQGVPRMGSLPLNMCHGLMNRPSTVQPNNICSGNHQ